MSFSDLHIYYIISRRGGIILDRVRGSTAARKTQVYYERHGVPVQAVRLVETRLMNRVPGRDGIPRNL